MPSFRSISSFTRQSAAHLATYSGTALLLAVCGAPLQAKTTEQDLIRQSLQTGQLAQAQKLLKTELQRLPKDVNLRLLEGILQAQSGQKDSAIETFKKLAADHPNLPEPHNNLGVLYAERNELDLAKAAFEKALQTLPSYTASHKNLMDLNARLAKQAYARAFRFDDPGKASAFAGGAGLIMLNAVGAALPDAAAPVVIAEVKTAPTVAPVAPVPAAPQAADKAPAKAESLVPKLPVPQPAPAPAPAPAQPAPQASPQPAPATAQKVEPATPATRPAPPTSTVSADTAAVEKAVKAWARAWSKRDVSQYLDAYAPNFEPANRQARASWAKDRRVRIEQRKFIRVTVSRLQISVKGAQAQVKLDQLYESDGLNTSTRKTLDLVNTGGRWLILREKAS